MRRGKSGKFARARARLTAVFAVLGVALLAGPSLVTARGESRTLSIYNVNTKESLTVTYKKNGVYDEDALRKINHIMRDWRRDVETKMDPELIDLIWELHTQLGSMKPVHLISGYRSAKTNERLRRRGGGQAKNSQHILGKAADIHFPDVDVQDLRYLALIEEVGGVGYYPRSGIPFVHVDTGRVRAWPRLPRMELAALFPSGRTKHIPADGRPLTPADARLALAKLKERGEVPFRVALASRQGPIPAGQVEPPVQVASASAPLPPMPSPAPESLREAVAVAAAAPPAKPATPAAAVVAAAVSGQEPVAARDAVANAPVARPILASLTSPTAVNEAADAAPSRGFGFGWLTRLDQIAQNAADQNEPMPQSRPREPQLAALASPSVFGLPRGALSEAVLRLRRIGADAEPEIDYEHPEELRYQPYSVLALLAEPTAANDDSLAGLAHPELDEVALRLPDMADGAVARFEPVGMTRPLPEPHFTGPAVSAMRTAAAQLGSGWSRTLLR